MIQKQVVIINDVYDCDIDVTVDEWKKILEDKNIKANNYIDMLIKFYNEPEHKSTCKAIGEKYNISPQSPNSIITNFAKATQKILNRFEVISTEGKPTYWIIPMTGKYIENNNFEWTMRPELVKAISQKRVENREDVKENLIQLFSYIRSENEDEIKFAKDLINYGSNFVIEFIEGEYLLGPSKFVGYFKNTYENHTKYINIRHGSSTDEKLKKIYRTINKTNDTHSSYINIFKNICSKYDIERNFDSINNIYIPEIELESNKEINIKNDMKEINTIINLLNSKKQIILQGAPGTGKTFITAEIAIALCDGIDNIPPTREKIMERYNELVNEERIAFSTFHQSMDYEEFIEGIKPIVENTSNTMIYKPQAGIFKKMYEKILEDISEEPKQYVNDTFEFLFDKLIEKIGNGKINTITQKKGKNKVITVSDQEIIKVDNYRVVKSKLKEIYKSCKQNCKVRDIRNSPKNIGKVSSTSAYWGVLQELYKIKESESRKKEALKPQIGQNDLVPYVLIIDEINRGNVSKIFGELITLLENDKRMGEKNELWATLPYSNEKFSVPSNLYIIGTMNTADRSLGYIDYAVRRRFAFYTLKADKSVIENYYQNNEALKSEAINLFDDVQKLISNNIASEFNVEDLMIGHSYFLVEDEEELNLKLEYEIKPLLREYAFDGILYKLNKVDGKYKEIENLGKLSNIITNNQDDSENGED